MSYLDLKIGYSCNNNCRHCVIDENRKDLERRNLPYDSKFSELIEIVSDKLNDLTDLVITGGEPFIRGKEVLRIIRFVTDRNPNCRISIQTNGRYLYKYIDQLFEINPNVYFVIALHGTKETHDIVTNNGKSEISPFDETMMSIRRLKELRNGFKNARLEVVLSRYNLDNIPEFLEFCKQEELKMIGISYPHLDGFYFHDIERFKSLTFSYKEFFKYFEVMHKFCEENPDYVISLEEVPPCARRNSYGELLPQLPNLTFMDNEGNAEVKFPSSETVDFKNIFLNMHKKFENCSKCKYNNSCLGVWEEYRGYYTEDDIIPVI